MNNKSLIQTQIDLKGMRTVFWILSISLIGLLFVVLVISCLAEARNITVDSNNGSDFNSIQAAVDAAEEGDSILIHEGLYLENVRIQKGINLIGENQENTTIDGGDNEATIYVNAYENTSKYTINIIGLTIKNGNRSGIKLDESYYVNISENIFHNNVRGIWLYGCRNITIDSNQFYDNGVGIHLDNKNTFPTQDSIIRSNEIRGGNGTSGTGIYCSGNKNVFVNNTLIECTKNWLTGNNNIFEDNEIIDHTEVGLYIGGTHIVNNNMFINNGIKSDYIGWKSIIENNTINGEMIHFLHNEAGTKENPVIIENIVGSIIMVNSSYLEIRNSNLSYGYYGIFASQCDNISIHENIISNNYCAGIFIHDVGAVNIQIYNNTICNNNKHQNSEGGIRVSGKYIYIEGNMISNNSKGIVIVAVVPIYHYFIYNNIISNNSEFGIESTWNPIQTESVVDAKNNWWGDNSGPYHPTNNPSGKGDNVTDYVDFEPWMVIILDDTNTGNENDIIPILGPIIALSLGALGLFGLAHNRENFRFATLSLLTIPLYTKLSKDELLDQSNRLDIYTFLLNNPGVNYSHLLKRLPMANGTLVHHLNVLTREGLIRSKKENGKRIFYPHGLGINHTDRISALPPSPIQSRILEYLTINGPSTMRKLEEECTVKQTTLSFNMRRLKDQGKVTSLGGKRNTLYRAVKGKSGGNH